MIARRSFGLPVALVVATLAASPIPAQRASGEKEIVLDAHTKATAVNGRLQPLTYRGRPALKLAPLAGHERDTDQEMTAILDGVELRDGAIDIDVAGARRSGYSTTVDSTGFKGIIGISFRVRGDTAERFYLRPENSRVADQLYRNRSAQYESAPGFSWARLRQENPGVYESYVDVESGAWTHLHIEIAGRSARLFVNGAKQPCLVVSDLKNGVGRGGVALWARISSDAYFASLRVTPSSL